MILLTGLIPETMDISHPNNTVIPIDIIKAISNTTHDQLVTSRDTIHEAKVDFEIVHVIFLPTHAHQVVFALEIDVQVGITIIIAQVHPNATCYVSDVVAHNKHLQIENVTHR